MQQTFALHSEVIVLMKETFALHTNSNVSMQEAFAHPQHCFALHTKPNEYLL